MPILGLLLLLLLKPHTQQCASVPLVLLVCGLIGLCMYIIRTVSEKPWQAAELSDPFAWWPATKAEEVAELAMRCLHARTDERPELVAVR